MMLDISERRKRKVSVLMITMSDVVPLRWKSLAESMEEELVAMQWSTRTVSATERSHSEITVVVNGV